MNGGNDTLGDVEKEATNAPLALDFSRSGLKEVPKIVRDHSDSLVSLDLTSNRLSSLPSWLLSLEKLEHLFLGYNSIHELPQSIDKLKSLKTLSIKRNKLASIPNTLANLEYLHSLNISHNQITILPTELGKATQLQELVIYGNPLESVPTSFSALRNTRIDVDDARLLVPAFSTHPNMMSGTIDLPREIQIPIQQYLQFFPEYYEMLHGYQIRFEILRRHSGLEVQYIPSSEIELEAVTESLQEFVSHISDSISRKNERDLPPITDVRKSIIEKELKNEIMILQLRLENRDFNLQLLKETNMTLSEAVRHLSAKSSPILIHNDLRQDLSLYQSNQGYSSSIDQLDSALDALRKISRDTELENEVEKLKAQIREAKNAPNVTDASNTGIATSAQRFAEKLRDANTTLGKIAKSVEGARESASTIYGAAQDLIDFFSGA